MSNDPSASKTQFKQYITSFTPITEIERGKTCPGCNEFLKPGDFRSKKGTRYGLSGTIRNNKCRQCESGMEVMEKTKSDLGEEIKDHKKEIYNLRSELDEYKQSMSDAMKLIMFTLETLLEPHRLDLDEVERRMNANERITLSSGTRTNNRQGGSIGAIAMLSKTKETSSGTFETIPGEIRL